MKLAYRPMTAAHLPARLFPEGHHELWLLTTPDPALRAPGFHRNLGWRRTGKYVRGDEVLVLCKHDVRA